MARVILLLLSMLAGFPAQAQAPAKPASADAQQARAALDVLKDDKKRADLIRVLEAIAQAQPAPAAAPPPVTAPVPDASAVPKPLESVVPLVPDSLGAQLLAGASDHLSRLSDELVGVVRTATDFPLIWYWLRVMALDESTHQLMLDVAWRLVIALSVSLGAWNGARRLLRKPMRSLAHRAPDRYETPDSEGIAAAELGETEKLARWRPSLVALLHRLPFALGGFALDLLPVVALLASGYACLGAGLATGFAPRYVILGVLHAVALYHVVMAFARMLLAAKAPRLTLFAVSPATAASALGWIRLTAAVTIYGVTFAETAVLFGMYALAHDTFLKILFLLTTLLICGGLLRHRAAIARLILAVPVASPLAASVRERIAATWHLVACLYLLSLWLVWALELPDGFGRLLRITLESALVLGLARLGGNLLMAALRRLLLPGETEAERADDLATRLRGYHSVAFRLGRIVVWSVAAVALLEAWGVPALEWFSADRLGGRLIGALVTVTTTAAVALLTWEAANLAIQRHLTRLAEEHQAARSARLRTLLPVLRTTLLVSICLVTALMALSEIGVNIAPLLAGAGVVGVAIGFGSQKLVQDIITGLFLLLENTMQVGDAVTLGGLSGTVENLSIRTIRLRALDGSVHIVPFSAVTTVTNMTRDFGFAVLDVRVGLNEHPDRIAGILREIAAEMRDDPAWATMMTGDLDVMGVDSFNVQSYTMRARVRTTPGGRWAVGRELNRRIKNRFDASAIESPLTSYRALGLPTPPPVPPEPSS